MNPIKILIIDDSKVAHILFNKIFEGDDDFSVVYNASSGLEALRHVNSVKPDLILMDYFMPKLSGAPLVAEMLKVHRCPILMTSGIISDSQSPEIFEALEAGALDFIPKPTDVQPGSDYVKKFKEKLRILSKVIVVERKEDKYTRNKDLFNLSRINMIVLGASTGGPMALEAVLKELPKDYPIPIVCIQHISRGFLSSFVEWLKLRIQMSVEIVKKKESLQAGTVYVPTEGKHLLFNYQKEMVLERGEAQEIHIPSIDKAMASAAKVFGTHTMGVLLTGMGMDGAKGIFTISKEGGMTVAQSESTSTVFGMPREAIEQGGVQHVLNLEEITDLLITTGENHSKNL